MTPSRTTDAVTGNSGQHTDWQTTSGSLAGDNVANVSDPVSVSRVLDSASTLAYNEDSYTELDYAESGTEGEVANGTVPTFSVSAITDASSDVSVGGTNVSTPGDNASFFTTARSTLSNIFADMFTNAEGRVTDALGNASTDVSTISQNPGLSTTTADRLLHTNTSGSIGGRFFANATNSSLTTRVLDVLQNSTATDSYTHIKSSTFSTWQATTSTSNDVTTETTTSAIVDYLPTTADNSRQLSDLQLHFLIVGALFVVVVILAAINLFIHLISQGRGRIMDSEGRISRLHSVSSVVIPKKSLTVKMKPRSANFL